MNVKTKNKNTSPSDGSPRALAAARLMESGLRWEPHAKQLGLEALDHKAMLGLLMRSGGPRKFGWEAGLLIPYFDEHGARLALPSKIDGVAIDFYRLRGIGGGAGPFGGVPDLRYAQPGCLGTPVYLPRLVEWGNVLADPQRRVVIVEGELKAACGCAHGIDTVALGGAYNFKSKKAGVDLDPFLARLASGGREVVIAYDNDGAPKPQVLKAEAELAHRLTEAGAKVKIARLPATAPGVKTGLDDLIAKIGAEAAEHAIATASEYEGDRALRDLNRKYVLVRKPVCIYEHATGSIHNEKAFGLLERNKTVPALTPGGKPTRVAANVAWLEWDQRAEASTMVYAPGEQQFTREGAVNVWPGWGCESFSGDVSPWRELLDHLFKGADPDARRWFEQWCAYPVQHPGAKLYSAAVFVSRNKGVGKSLVAELLGEVYGVKADGKNGNASFITPKELGSQFSEWLLGTSLVVCEEMTGDDYKSRRAVMDSLKHLVTGATVQINEKGVPRFSMSNRANLIFNTNHLDSLRIEDGDRRFFVHQVIAQPMAVDHGKRIGEWGRSRNGAAALRHYLENLDLAGFIPQAAPPMTDAKRLMTDVHQTELDQFLADLLENATPLLLEHGDTKSVASKCELLSVRQIVNVFNAYKSEASPPVSDGPMGKALAETAARRYPKGVVRVGKTRQMRLWAIRNPELWATRPASEWGAHYEACFPEVPKKH